MARQVVNRFSNELETKIDIKRVRIYPFNRMSLEGVYVEDQKKDTLLYAGSVEVRITDWFFLKDEADLKYIGLKNAVVHFNRTDSVWNYSFLESYFSTPSSPKKKEAGIQFNLKKIDLVNVAFIKKDAWLGSDLTARVGTLAADVKDLSISRQSAVIASTTLTDPYFHMYSYPAKGKSRASGGNNWHVQLNEMIVKNGVFRQDNGTLKPDVSYFDTEHLHFSKINGTVRNFTFRNNEVAASASLSAVERSGLHIHALKADFQYGPTALVFDNLLLQTNRSRLGNYLALRYKSPSDLKNFITDVQLNTRLSGAVIHSDDLAFFDPGMKRWKKVFRVTGNISGTVAALKSNDLDLWAGNNTRFRGAASIVGLPNLPRAYLNISAKEMRTTYADLITFVPGLKTVQTPNLKKLNYFRFAGTFKGRLDDFNTNGVLQTALGDIHANLSMKLPARADAQYAGTLATTGFQLGAFLNNNQLGVLDFRGAVNGRGFDLQRMHVTVNGEVNRFRYDKYTYQNIVLNGTINHKKFNGRFRINDPNANLSINGIVDISGRVPVFNATADVAFANLQPLQLTKEDIVVRGVFDVNMSGSNLSNLLGTARISNASVVHEGQPLSFDSLYVFSGYQQGIRTLTAISNEFDGTITGNFDIAGLPDAFRAFLSRYYPSYIRRPDRVTNQDFSFHIKTGVVEDYLRLIDKNLNGFNNSEIRGSLHIAANTMTIDADVPYFSFKNNEFSDIRLTGKGDFEQLTITGEAENIIIDSSVVFPTTNFTITSRQDISDVTLVTTSNQPVDQASLSARVTTFPDGFSVEVNPSTFVLNGKTWTIEEGGELVFRNNNIIHGELVLTESQQELIVRSVPSSVGNWNDLVLTIRNLNLNDLSPILLPKNRLEGTLSGEIVVEDPENKFLVTGNITADEVRLDNDSIGRVTALIQYDKRTGVLTGKGSTADLEHNLAFDIAINLNTPANSRITLALKDFKMAYLERFLGGIFTNIRGFATGNLNISNAGNHMDYTGKFRIRDAALKVVFTQVDYTIEDTEIELRKDYVDLNGIRIRDAAGQLAIVTGGISHRGWANMNYDIAVQTQSQSMELLNTTYKHSQIFYGRAFGSGSFVLIGPEYDMNMFIDIRSSDVDSSWLTLPPARTRESGEAAFMVERKYGVELSPEQRRGGAINLSYDISLTATPLANVQVILDQLTGDYIKGRGTGHLRISSGTSIPLTITGRYDIDEGNYLYTFQSVLKKPFVLRKGANNYIEWTRDPYDARVNIEAIYTAERVSFAPLATTLLVNQAQSRSLAQLRDNVNVIATMTGELFQPNFNFRLEFPSNSAIYNNPAVAFGIQQIENNPNELYKQVTYLIVFNSFAPYGGAAPAGISTFEEFTFSTASGLFFNVLNQELNQLFTRIFRNNRFTFNFSGSLYNRNLIDPNSRGIRLFNQVASNVSVGTSLFNERAIFTVGGTFDVPLESNVQNNIQLLPDVSLEILLNRTGSVRATFFYRQNVDFIYGSTTSGSPTTKRFGAGISYNREFDSISDLIFGRRKKPERDTLLLPAADSSATDQ